ncbi:MAG: hypothetical protein KC503_46815 [Myxococcales bacterium]|nr:hypothetical protein [Myxococcales bacterium]
MKRRTTASVLLGTVLLAALASCSSQGPSTAQRAALPERAIAALVQRAGRLEVPRYVKYRELDPSDRMRVLRSPTLQRVRAGRSGPAVLRRDRTYLYSVTARGSVLIAEKASFGTNSECGHPNLTGAQPARISGELNYDAKRGAFVMDNDSGRYGFQPSRRRENLEAARALLAAAGGVRDGLGRRIPLATRWIKPWNNAKMRRWDRVRPLLKGAPQGFDAIAWRRAFVAQMGYRDVPLSIEAHTVSELTASASATAAAH